MSRVIHFEIHADNPERAAKFYNNLFGWEIKEWKIPGIEIADYNRYWLVTTGKEGTPGINGGIIFRKGERPKHGQPVSAFVCTVGVRSVDETLEKAQGLKAVVALPKMAIQNVGWLAYLIDTEGNIFGIMEEDKNAK